MLLKRGTLMHNHDAKLDKLQSDFKKFYDENLVEDYARIEKFRVCYLALFAFTLCCFICVFSCIFNYLSKDGWHDKETELMIKTMVIGACFCYIPVIWFDKITKINVMEKFVSFFDGMKYGKNSIVEEDLIKSELFNFFNECRYKDCLSGCYKGVNINISEIKLLVCNMASRRYISNYNGVVIKLDFYKNKIGKTVGYINSDIVLFKERILITSFCLLPILLGVLFFKEYIIPLCIPLFFLFVYSLLSFLKKILLSNKCNKKMIKLEDVVFSKKWNIFADDQVEARCILTPALMERLLEIKSLFKGELLNFSFFDNQLLISLPGANMFETTSLFRSALRYDRIKKVVNEFYCIFSIIDILKLEDKKEQSE